METNLTGFNTIVNNDCLNTLKSIPDNSIDMVLTDPPYFIVEEVSVIRRGNKMKYKGTDIDFKNGTSWDRIWKNKEEYFIWLKEIMKEMVRVLKDNHHLLICCDKKDLSYLANFGEDLGCRFRPTLFWRKLNPVPQARQISPMKSIEMICWLTKGQVKVDNYNWQLGMVSDVIEAPIPQREGATSRHPTQKPLKLGLWMVSRFSKPGGIILDCFAGSGTFPICAKVLNRNFIGIEKDEKYAKVALERINGDTSKVIEKAQQLYQELLKVKPKTVKIEDFNNLFYGNNINVKEDTWF